MAKHEPILDIDHLRSFEVDPAYFGLGFIQLKIKRNGRVHFYHKDLPVLADEPHNHRYGFISYIMQGHFEQELWQFTPGPGGMVGDYYMDFEDCNPDLPDGPKPRQVLGSLEEIFHAEYQAGDYYRGWDCPAGPPTGRPAPRRRRRPGHEPPSATQGQRRPRESGSR